MIDFLIKSTVSLGILYLFYILFLSRIKTFSFNRYFLLGSLVFSLVIPFIIIPVESNVLPLPDATGIIAGTGTIEQTGVSLIPSQEQGIITIEVLSYFYVAICLILFLRFTSNLFSIIKTIYGNQKESNHNYKLVLVNRQVLPHTFFRYILVNKDDYENDRIDEMLIQHEVAHCEQWHSLDIIFVELVKVFVWINPFIWLFKKQIQLNHEYLADSSVLMRYELKEYQKTLVDIVFAKNTELLVSNFNYSFTKQRLKMMLIPLSKKAITLNVGSIAVIFLVGFTFANFQIVNQADKSMPEVIVKTDKFDYLIGMEYTDENALEGLIRKTRAVTTYQNGEITGQTYFFSNGYTIVTSERITKNEEANIKVYKIYDILVLNDNYKTCLGCFQSKINKDNILSIHPVSGVTRDTIHAAFKIDKETLRYRLVDYSDYEWVHKGGTSWKEFNE